MRCMIDISQLCTLLQIKETNFIAYCYFKSITLLVLEQIINNIDLCRYWINMISYSSFQYLFHIHSYVLTHQVADYIL